MMNQKVSQSPDYRSILIQFQLCFQLLNTLFINKNKTEGTNSIAIENIDDGFGVCGNILIAISYLLFLFTLPLSLFVSKMFHYRH
jgi:hypothetical protein